MRHHCSGVVGGVNGIESSERHLDGGDGIGFAAGLIVA
jgi:hypothetical protein